MSKRPFDRFGRSHLQNAVFYRELTGQPVRQRHFLESLSSSPEANGATILVNPGGVGTPPFCAEYNKVCNDCRFLAVADEEGFVSILDTSAPCPASLYEEHAGGRPQAQWLGHHNAIFDVGWAKADERLLTASGDQTVALWDTMEARCLGSFRGHTGSVKSVCPHPSSPDVFASGGRDGMLLMWDARCNGRASPQAPHTQLFKPISIIQDAHMLSGRAKTPRRRTPLCETKHSVTCVLFLRDDRLLATAGASDGVVKLWDTRRSVRAVAQLSSPEPAECVWSMRPPSSTLRQHGVTCLAQDPCGSRLLVSTSSSVHYLISSLRPEAPPAAVFNGHGGSSFYIKAAFSGDGTHILSGSTDGRACIWQVDRGGPPTVRLAGHSGEVTAVAWCPADLLEVATCSDDASIKLWRLPPDWRAAPHQAAAEEPADKENQPPRVAHFQSPALAAAQPEPSALYPSTPLAPQPMPPNNQTAKSASPAESPQCSSPAPHLRPYTALGLIALHGGGEGTTLPSSCRGGRASTITAQASPEQTPLQEASQMDGGLDPGSPCFMRSGRDESANAPPEPTTQLGATAEGAPHQVPALTRFTKAPMSSERPGSEPERSLGADSPVSSAQSLVPHVPKPTPRILRLLRVPRRADRPGGSLGSLLDCAPRGRCQLDAAFAACTSASRGGLAACDEEDEAADAEVSGDGFMDESSTPTPMAAAMLAAAQPPPDATPPALLASPGQALAPDLSAQKPAPGPRKASGQCTMRHYLHSAAPPSKRLREGAQECMTPEAGPSSRPQYLPEGAPRHPHEGPDFRTPGVLSPAPRGGRALEEGTHHNAGDIAILQSGAGTALPSSKDGSAKCTQLGNKENIG